MDEIYEALIIKPIHALSVFFYKQVDVLVVDGFVNRLADFTRFLAQGIRLLQSGRLAHYLATMACGVAVLLAIAFYF